MASNRNQKNFISKLKNDEGVWVDWDSGLQEVIMNFYSTLFTSSCMGETDPILQHVSSKVSQHQNQFLLSPYTPDEVQTTSFSMHPDKSLKPDGLNPGFFQTYWDIVRSDVITACLNCLNSDACLLGQNRTHIILIP